MKRCEISQACNNKESKRRKTMFDWLKKDKPNQVEITVSNGTVLRVLAMTIASFLFLAAIKQASSALSLVAIAFFLTIALNAPVNWLARHMPGRLRGSRAVGTGASFIIIIVLLGGFLASMVPPLVRQTANFLNEAPALVEDLRNKDSALGKFVQKYNLEDQVDKLSSELSDKVGNVGGTAVSTASRIGSSVFSTLTVLVLTFMMLLEAPGWLKLFRKLLPKDRRAHADKLMIDMYKVVRGYVNGQVLLAATAALLILVPLFILNISYPIALMVIVFICGLIPMVGHFIGAAIVSVVALFSSPGAAIAILAYYMLYQQIENYVVQPTIQSNSTNMSPLLVFVSVLVGVNFGGLLGGLVAIPVAGCLRVLLLDYLNNRNILETATVVESAKNT
jgi:predicted PurR-regulated permease PerM